jgi:hypothetical protein
MKEICEEAIAGKKARKNKSKNIFLRRGNMVFEDKTTSEHNALLFNKN